MNWPRLLSYSSSDSPQMFLFNNLSITYRRYKVLYILYSFISFTLFVSLWTSCTIRKPMSVTSFQFHTLAAAVWVLLTKLSPSQTRNFRLVHYFVSITWHKIEELLIKKTCEKNIRWLQRAEINYILPGWYVTWWHNLLILTPLIGHTV